MSLIQLGSLRVDVDQRTIERDGVRRERLTTLEAAVLRYLLDAGGPVSRDELLTEVWGYAGSTMSRACDITIRRLRTKIEEDPSQPKLLLTVHGTGYRLLAPEVEPPRLPVPSAGARRYVFGDRTIDVDRQHIETPEGYTPLTRTEALLLAELLAAGGEAIDRDTLQRRVWGTALGNPLKSSVSRLRRKLEVDPVNPRLLLTTANGYRLEVPLASPGPPQVRTFRLPAEVDRRFGGEDGVASVVRWLAEGDRLITLTGPGGVGKTRLALASAARLRAEGRPVVWVDAHTARSPEELWAELVLALQTQVTGEPLEALIQILAAEPDLVLVLDNLEQVEGAGEAIGALLAGAAPLRVVATSRTLLRSRGERVLVVEPLSIEDAVELFFDRCVRRPRETERAEVSVLVTGLDRLPLSIELAAARTGMLSVSQLREQMGAALALLSSVPGRSKTLRASLEASWILLSGGARGALAQLTVFNGSFALEAALEVVDQGTGIWPIDLLQELMDASLLRLDVDRGLLSMFAIVRAFASEHLAQSDRSAAELRHGRFYARPLVADGERLEDALSGPRRHELLGQIERDLSEIRAALTRAIDRGDPQIALRTLRAAWPIWSIHGPFTLALRAADRVLEMPLAPEARAEVELIAGALRTSLGEPSEPHLHTARALARQSGEADLEARAMLEIGRLHFQRSRIDEAKEALDEAVLFARRSGLWSLECRSLMLRGILQRELAPAQVPEILEAAERIALTHGSTTLTAKIANRLGTHAVRQGRLDEGARQYARGRLLGSDDRDPLEEATVLYDLGVLHFQRGEIAKALENWTGAEASHRRIGKRLSQAMALNGISAARSALGESDKAEVAMLQALDLFRRCDSRIDIIYSLICLGLLTAARNEGSDRTADAVRWFREALDLALADKDRVREAYARVNLGQTLWVRGIGEGLQELQDAAEAFAALDCPVQRGQALVSIGRALADVDRLEEAITQANEALALGERLRHGLLREAAEALLAALEARTGALEAARARIERLKQHAAARSSDQRAHLLIAEAEIARAESDSVACRAALDEAARLVNPVLLGRRYCLLSERYTR